MIESPRHQLDEAIDRVAAKLVAADEDAVVLHRVMARLPERTATPWFLTMPAQIAAAAALVMIAFVFARPSNELAPVEANLSAKIEFALASYPVVSAQPPTIAFRLPSPGSRLPAVAMDRPDHERSLAPVDVIEAIELSVIAAPAIELDAPALLEPLVLTDLSLETKGDS